MHALDIFAERIKGKIRLCTKLSRYFAGSIEAEFLRTGQTGGLDSDQTPECRSRVLDGKIVDSASIRALRIRP